MCHTSPLLISPHQQHRRPTSSEQLNYMGWDSLVQGCLQQGMQLHLGPKVLVFPDAICQI